MSPLPYGEDPARITRVRQSVTQITRIHPPVPAHYDRHTITQAPAHDPVRARQVVNELSTVAGVVEEFAPVRRTDIGHPRLLEDLDYVAVGCWGTAVQITDPALGEDGITSFNLDIEFDAQVKGHPDARVIGVCEMSFSETYAKYLVHVPGAPRVSADGWDDMDLTGDPTRTLSAIGITPGDPATSDISRYDLENFIWSDYVNALACGLHVPLASEKLTVSVFKVTRSEDTQDAIEDVWHRE
ncbi:DUF6333 family protein [Streptomyces sp. RGM 3693]|uniref:DUF6333 family protein n=1 Tax=Streptomyces sp. RGM 3693 TaxID=3413284 RepID=UPI003D282EF1